MLYWLIFYFTKIVSRLFFPLTVYGSENLPRTGSFIIASNHVSNIDPMAIGISVPRRISYMAKDSLFRNFILRYVLLKIEAFPIKRETADIGALREAIRRLKSGSPLLIFPEGTRAQKDDFGQSIAKLHQGIGFLVVKSGVSVIPARIKDSDKVLPPGATFFNRHPVAIVFGEPMVFNSSESYEAIVGSIMGEINNLSRRLTVSG